MTPQKSSLNVVGGGAGDNGTGATVTTASNQYAIITAAATASATTPVVVVGSAHFAIPTTSVPFVIYVGPSTAVSTTVGSGTFSLSYVLFQNT